MAGVAKFCRRQFSIGVTTTSPALNAAPTAVAKSTSTKKRTRATKHRIRRSSTSIALKGEEADRKGEEKAALFFLCRCRSPSLSLSLSTERELGHACSLALSLSPAAPRQGNRVGYPLSKREEKPEARSASRRGGENAPSVTKWRRKKIKNEPRVFLLLHFFSSSCSWPLSLHLLASVSGHRQASPSLFFRVQKESRESALAFPIGIAAEAPKERAGEESREIQSINQTQGPTDDETTTTTTTTNSRPSSSIAFFSIAVAGPSATSFPHLFRPQL